MLHIRRVANNGAQFCQGRNFFAAAGLYEDVSEDSGFHRSGDDWPLAGVGCELIQQAVARTPTNNVDDFYALTGDGFQLGEDCLIFEREAFENATNDCTFRRGHRLASPAAEGLNGGGHVERV